MKEFIVFNDIQRASAEIKGIFMTVWTLEKSICMYLFLKCLDLKKENIINDNEWMSQLMNEWSLFWHNREI